MSEAIIHIREIPDYWTGLVSRLDNRLKELNRIAGYTHPNSAIRLIKLDWGLKIEKPEYPAVYIDIYLDSDKQSVRIEGRRVDGPDNRRVSKFDGTFNLRKGSEWVTEEILRPIAESHASIRVGSSA